MVLLPAVGPVLATSVYARVRDSLLTLVGYGVDPLGQGIYQVTAGRDLARGDSLGLLVSRRTAARTGWRLGDTVTLLGRLDPQAAVAAVTRRFIVRGEADWLYDSRDDLSVVECLSRAAQRPEDHAGVACRSNRDDLHGGHQPFEQRVLGIGGIHHEPYGPIDAGHEQEAIDERHMVRDE